MSTVPSFILGRGRSLYILPTRDGLTYALVLLATLIAAMNYGNGPAYALTFLLAAVGLVATLHTHRNLAGLTVLPGPVTPVHAGEPARFGVVLRNDSGLPRHALELRVDGQQYAVDVPARASVVVDIPVATTRRGYLEIPAISLRTRFPLGLWRVWSRTLALGSRCLVYPRPGEPRPLPEAPGDAASASSQAPMVDGEDFAGLRAFRAGDPVQRVAWKKTASGHGWHTKQFAAPVVPIVWLDWDQTPARDAEERLGLLCRWVLMAEARGVSYGLHLPEIKLEPGAGTAHRERCLELLALFRAPA
jgi:uncharacterized protein (DUF58 family)